jgi:hypothetical protein
MFNYDKASFSTDSKYGPQESHDSLLAGTGFMISLSDTIRHFEQQGYDKNLVVCFDHFECDSGRIKIYPNEIVVDQVVRFENTSDPDDQSILYAVSVPGKRIKGLFVESYGLYHEDVSSRLLAALTH